MHTCDFCGGPLAQDYKLQNCVFGYKPKGSMGCQKVEVTCGYCDCKKDGWKYFCKNHRQ